VGGARVEYSLIQMDTFDVLGDPLHVRKLTVDPLPGVNLIYSPRDDMNVRASWSESVSRPEFRELAPVEFPAQRGELSTFGNPDLVQAEIKNYDLRWEWFFSPLEIVSLSFFYKDITNQIEPVIFLQGSDPALIYLNADEATLIGFEFEGRKDFGFVHRHLKPFSLLTNVTYAESDATIPVQRLFGVRTVQTNTSRPLQGQAPFIVNAALEYDRPDVVTARLLYFTADDRISAVGSNGLPDIVEQRRDQIDAVVIVPLKKYLKGAPISMKLSAENITNSPIVFRQGDELQRRYTTGVKLTLGFSYTY
jgi:outer membrane receptor protein involved in Fe transport